MSKPIHLSSIAVFPAGRRLRALVPALLLALVATPAVAESGIDLGVGLGFSISDGDVDSDLTAVALRAHHWTSDRWGFEGALSKTEEGDFSDGPLYLDLSAMYRLSENERFSWFLFGGVGALEYRARYFNLPNGQGVVDEGDDVVPTFHVGLGFEISLTEKLYFRPDLRHRRHLDVIDQLDDSSFDATLGIGWKF